MQLAAGNIIVHAVAYNASCHCACRRHDDDRTAAVTAAGRAAARSRTARGRAAARVIAAGGRRYRGNRAAGASHIQCETCIHHTSYAPITIVHYVCAFIDRQNVPFDCAIDPFCNPVYIKALGQISQVKRTVRVQGNGVNIIKIGTVNIRKREIELRVVVQIQAGEMVIPKPQCSQFWTIADIQHGQLVVETVQIL